jgi:hypothetical protein
MGVKIIFPWEVDDEARSPGATQALNDKETTVASDEPTPDGKRWSTENILMAAKQIEARSPGSVPVLADGLERLSTATGLSPSELVVAIEPHLKDE